MQTETAYNDYFGGGGKASLISKVAPLSSSDWKQKRERERGKKRNTDPIATESC